MNKLILHVGPGKCGSSTIQEFFNAHKSPCVEKTAFIVLNPRQITNLNQIDPTQEATNYFTNLLHERVILYDTIILSHEYLFDCPIAIKNICSIYKTLFDQVFIIGYCRRQSGYAVSVYSQWLFRLPQRVQEVSDVITKMGIDPIYFSGLERQLIASIANDFYSIRHPSNALILDWSNYYGQIEQLVASYGVKIKCGTLPDNKTSKNLIQDFCEKSGLTIKASVIESTNSKANIKFNPDLIEAVNNAIAFDLDAPTPNSNNSFLFKFSQVMGANTVLDNAFVTILKTYIDCYFYSSNIELCEKYDLEKQYFELSIKYSKDNILDIIRTEQQERVANNTMLNMYKQLSGTMAQACFRYNQIEAKQALEQGLEVNKKGFKMGFIFRSLYKKYKAFNKAYE